MNKNIIIGGLVVAVATLTVVNVTQNRKKETVPEVVIQEKSTEASSSMDTAKKLADAERKLAQARRIIVQLEEELLLVEDTPEMPAEEAAEPEKKPQPSMMEGIAKMMQDPKMKDMIKAQQKMAVGMTHNELLNYLQLPPEKTEAFKSLLIDKQMDLMDEGMGMLDKSLSAWEREERAADIKRIIEEHDHKLQEFLGEDDFAVYEEYEATQSERRQVNSFKAMLPADQQLSAEQEHELIVAMNEENANFKPVDPRNLSQSTAERHERYIERAEPILTEPQMESFNSSLQAQRSMAEMMQGIIGLMMGISEEGKQPASQE